MEVVKIFVYLLEIDFIIYDSFSLKDKRKTVRSILDFARKNLNIAAAEIGDLDLINKSKLAFVTISNNNDLAKSILEPIVRRLETKYQVEILDKNLTRIY